MNRKVVSIVVVAVLIAFAGVFAVVHNNSKSSDLLSQLEGENESVKPLDQVKLTFYLWGSGEPKATREVLENVEKKSEGAVNAKLDFKFINEYPSSYINRMKTFTSSGQPCDAFYFTRQFPDSIGALGNEGVIKDITELFPQNAPNYFSQLSKEEVSAVSSDGKIYAVPNRIPSTQMRCAVVREDLMKKYDIPDIKNYDDYEKYLDIIKKNETGILPMMFYETAIGLFAEANGYVVLDYVQGLVYKWDDPQMKVLLWEQTPEYKKGLETISRWCSKGYLLQNVGATQIDQNMITSGKWASFITTLGTDLQYNALLMSKGISWRYKAYPLYPDKISERSIPFDGGFVISDKSPHPERVLMFIDWLQSSQEHYDSLMYGIAGKHYILKDDRIQLPKDVKADDSCFNWTWHWPFSNIVYERIDAGSPEGATKEYYKIINEKTQYPPHMGFVPDYTTITDITNARQRTFYMTEQKIYSGGFKAEDLQDYINERKAEGADKLVSEVQRQLDKWKLENKK